jgi:hypothetical protein
MGQEHGQFQVQCPRFTAKAYKRAPNSPGKLHGPDINNFEVAIHKVTRPTGSESLEFRLETFSTFNHTQFDGRGSVDGHINDATFGNVVNAPPPRISQAALKLFF